MELPRMPRLWIADLPESQERNATLSDVFGISRSIPLNYVPRSSVDNAFKLALGRGKHVVVHGSSKQGKTCLRKWNLDEDDHITITCSNRWNLAQLFISILKQAGFAVAQSESRTYAGDRKVTAKAEIKIDLPGFESTGSVEGSRGGSTSTETAKALELDPHDANEVIDALGSIAFHKYIVLEDFHYLPRETQRDFAVALKAFHENSDIVVIVVGVWLDENKLVQFNGDLTGRVIAINADAWTDRQLAEVIDRGAELLGIRFARGFSRSVLNGCFESVWVVQEVCYKACLQAGVVSDRAGDVVVGTDMDVQGLIGDVVNQQAARYGTFIPAFADGASSQPWDLYRWILCAILITDTRRLVSGLTFEELRTFINTHHPERPVSGGILTESLRSIVSFQLENLCIKPTIFDYDETARRLNVVDRSFLVWLEYQYVTDILDEIDVPSALSRHWLEARGAMSRRHRFR